MYRAGITEKLSRVVKALLRHKYTLTKYVEERDEDGDIILNDDGHPTVTLGTPDIDKPGLFDWNDRSVLVEGVVVQQRTPVLYTDPADDVSVGDIITNIKERDGSILLTSAIVSGIDNTAEMGSSVTKMCMLSGFESP